MIKGTTYLDKSGVAFEILLAEEKDIPKLMVMYDDFEPKGVAQGLPPRKSSSSRKEWLNGLFKGAINIVAQKNEELVVGHAAIYPDYSRMDCEFIIFVHQDHRNQGIGTKLTLYSINHAKEIGLKLILLSVAVFNYPAIKLYSKCGFEIIDSDGSERTMKMMLDK